MNLDFGKLHNELIKQGWFEILPRLFMDQYAQETMAKQAAYGGIRQVPYREQLQNNIRHLKEQLSKNEELLKLLDENPAIERFMDLSRS